jgi:Tfp pilus assembly protein PilZ
METPLDVHQAKCINVSTRGVYFITDAVLRVGEAVQILLEMPKRVSGLKGGIRRFTGRVTHIQRRNTLREPSGIGVQLLYYERDLETALLPLVP